MANKHTKRCSILLIIREMQIKTMMSYHFTHIRIARIKKSCVTNVSEGVCWGPEWGTPPMAKVMRKEAPVRKGGIEPQESPWKSSSIYPHNQSLPTLLLCAHLNSRLSRLPFEYPGSAGAGPRQVWRNWISVHCWWECKMLLCKNRLAVPQ